MNINEVYKFAQLCVNKNQSGFLTPNDFNLNLPRAYSEWITKTYENSKPNDTTGYEDNQKTTDDLSFLKVPEKVVSLDSTGSFSKPDDYLHMNYMSFNKAYLEDGVTQVDVKGIDIVRDNELPKFLGSHIYKKSLSRRNYIMATIGADNIRIYPNDIQRVNFSYLRKPVDPFWAFILERGRPVYDPVNSIDLEAPDEAVNEIVMMTLSYAGINLREPELVNYSEMMKEQGV
jgi:hypothetical protein